MMRYPVEWEPEAQADLATIWLDAPDRTSVNLAERVVDRLLSRAPKHAGQLVAEGL